MADFALQFALERVPELAARYADAADTEVLAIGRTASERGFYTRRELRIVCRWKSPRSAPLVARNGAGAIRSATRVALSPASGERERVEALLSLRGVAWPTASVLLHVAYPERYPILDVRALHALGARPPVTYGYALWSDYVTAWRRVAAEAGVDGRTLDRALWQWSRERSATSPAARPRAGAPPARTRPRTARRSARSDR
jgi:hypothetical protein